MKNELKTYIPLCEAIGKLFYPNVEVVMHDLESKTLVYIVNAFSKRRVGDAMINDIKDLTSLKEDWVGPYNKTNDDGKKLKAVSIILRDSLQNKPIGMICINYDISTIETLFDSLKTLMSFDESNQKPPVTFSQNWKEHTDKTIDTFLREKNISFSALTTKEKKELVLYLNSEGIFGIRNVVNYICGTLNVSRATIYNWLKEN
jgi:predicted transcriptional regulator YheO